MVCECGAELAANAHAWEMQRFQMPNPDRPASPPKSVWTFFRPFNRLQRL
jgi:hypothetical protein